MMDKEGRARILVVDDEPTNIELIKGYLEKEYDVVSACSGKEALEKLYSKKPDVVLLDIMMPEISGYEVCAKIKQDEINAIHTRGHGYGIIRGRR